MMWEGLQACVKMVLHARKPVVEAEEAAEEEAAEAEAEEEAAEAAEAAEAEEGKGWNVEEANVRKTLF